MTLYTILCTCACLLLLAASLQAVRDRPMPARVLVPVLVAVAAVEICDWLTLAFPEQWSMWKRGGVVAESLLPGVWLFFAFKYCRIPSQLSGVQKGAVALSAVFPVAALSIPLDRLYYSPDLAAEAVLFLEKGGYLFYAFMILPLTLALATLESTVRSATGVTRWKIKLEFLGAGLLLAVQIFYYSQGLLYRALDLSLVPVRAAMVIAGLCLMLYSRSTRGEAPAVQLSRNLVYGSMVLFSVGTYLVFLGLLGEGLKYFGNSSQRTVLLTAAFVAGGLLVTVILSERVKRKVLLFLHRNFYRDKYDYRAQWSDFTRRLAESAPSDLNMSVVTAFIETFGMRCGALYRTDRKLGVACLLCESGFRSLPDTIPMDERFANGFGAEGTPLRLDAYNGIPGSGICLVPLTTHAGVDWFILLGEPLQGTESYGEEDFDLMKAMASQASAVMLNLRLSDELSQAREVEAVGKVAAFVMHDLKNLVSSLSLILDNAGRHISNPEFQQDMLESLRSTTDRMKTLISRLRELPEKRDLHRGPVDLLHLVKEVCELVEEGVEVRGVPVQAEVDREEMQKVAVNLLLNAVEAKGSVTVEVGEHADPYIRFSDNGCGMTREFMRDSLFTPFRSTKEKGLGIGLYQCRQIVEMHGGRIDVVSEPGRGSIFTIWLPRMQGT